MGFELDEDGSGVQYKLRLFYNPTVDMKTASGKIDVRKGSKDYVLGLLKDNLDKCSKVIVEVI